MSSSMGGRLFGRLRIGLSLRIVFVLLVLIPTTTLTVVAVLRELDRQTAVVYEELEVLAALEQEAILEDLQRDQLVLLSESQESAFTLRFALANAQPDVSQAIVNTAAGRMITASGGRFSRVLLINSEGVVVGGDKADLLGESVAQESWFQRALETPPGEVRVDGIQIDPLNEIESIYYSVVLTSGTGSTIMGVLAVQLPVSTLETTVGRLPLLGETVEILLVRNGQRAILPPRLAPETTLLTDPILSQALDGAEGRGTWQDYRGERVFGAYRWVEPIEITVIAKQDISDALGNQQLITILLYSAVGILISALALVAGIVITRDLTRPLERLSGTASRISQGELSVRATPSDIAEIDELANSFNRMAERLQEVIRNQEDIILNRTHQLEIITQIGRILAAETDLETLMRITIQMIRDRLGYYHAQIFLVDDLRQFAVLRASTGPVGQELLRREHKLAVGSQSVIGQVAERGEVVLARDTDTSVVHRRNELLPDTRAELAVPLRIGDQIIGALDVQSVQADAFDENTISLLQTVADQLAVAIRNAQLFLEKEGLLSASLQLTGMLTRDSWASYVEETEQSGDVPRGYRYNLSEVMPLEDGDAGTNGHGLNLPIMLRGEVIGQLELLDTISSELSTEDRELANDVLDRVALALDNARLFEQTQSSLMETNRVYQASQSVAEADSITSLASHLQEMAATIPGVDRVVISTLRRPEEAPKNRAVNVVINWARSGTGMRFEVPASLRSGQFPLLGVDEAPADGLVLNDIPTSGAANAIKAEYMQNRVMAAAHFPLIAGRRTLGWISMYSMHQPHTFREADRRFFETISDQAATALEGLLQFEQTQVRARRLQATNEVTRAASSILNLDILLPLIVEQIASAFDYYHVQIFLVDEQGEWAVLQASTGPVGQELLRRKHRLGVGSQSVIGRVTNTGDPVIIRDTGTEEGHRPNELLPLTRAEMAIPLKTGDRVIGALDVQSTEVNAFDEEAQIILQSLADQISVTLENAQLFQEIQDRVAELTTINLVSQAVSRTETLDDLYDVVTVQLMRTFGAEYGFLGVLTDPETLALPIFIEGGKRLQSPPPQVLGQGLSGYVIRNRQTVLLNNNIEQRAKEFGASISGDSVKSLLMVPLLLGDEAIGVISIQNVVEENVYEDAHIRQLTTLAAYIAVKIRNAELLEEANRRVAELGFLFSLTRAAVQSTDLHESMGNVAEILLNEVNGAESVVIYLSNEDYQNLVPYEAVGYGRERLARQELVHWGSGLVGEAAAQRIPIAVFDAREEPYQQEGQTRAAAVVPLVSGRQSIGVLSIESSRPGAFSQDQLRLLETVSGTLSAVIQNARLLEEISAANERLTEVDKLKSQFLANMSHELRTPLNSIIGFSKVMLNGIDGPLNDIQIQDLNTINQSGIHLLGLINDILDISKIEAGKMEIHPEYTSLVDIIDGVMATAQGLIKDKPIHLYREIEPDLPEVYGDSQRVRQVLLNLVSNAAKFTHEGSITIVARRIPADPSRKLPPSVQISVKDTGIGIAENDFDKLFEAFRQVDGSTTRQVGGTGLGLPISKQFVEMHGGQMWVESAEGEGSTFHFTIPLHAPQDISADIIVSTERQAGQPVVLAVDDEPKVLDLYQRYLSNRGYAMIGLSNANDVVRHVREINPVAILIDINMPGRDGWQAIADLKRDDVARPIPIIVCSITDERQRGFNMGAMAYLTKPIVEEELINAVEHALRPAPGEGSWKSTILRRVLIVDPDQAHATALSQSLEETGRYMARSVAAGYEALQSIMERKVDIVILDLDLPDMDGFGLLVSMRSHPDTKDIPILILTNRALSEDDIRRASLGHTAYLNKDTYDNDTLLSSLAAAVQPA